jgi:hypothetical protein
LEDIIIPRGNRRKPLRDDGTPYPLAFETLSMYVKALADLHSIQDARGLINPNNGKLRGLALRSWLKNKHQQEHRRRRENYEDLASNTAQDGYSLNDLENISMFYFDEQKERSFRDRAIFLMNHTMLLRSETTRDLSLADLFYLNFPDEGESKCPALVLRLDHGKTNKFNKIQFSATIRNKNVELCAFGAFAMYLFYRFHITMEDFPTFTSNRTWFDIKAMKNMYPTKAMSYHCQLDAVNRVFKALRINISKKTHAGRASGAQIAEIDGASEDELRRHGHWQGGSLEKVYLLALPRRSIRIINGFSGNKGEYWLPRSKVLRFFLLCMILYNYFFYISL